MDSLPEELWQLCTRDHIFLQEVKTGKIDPIPFNRWLEQDYLFVKSFHSFLASLLSKGPPDHHRQTLMNADATLVDELEWFRRKAKERGVELSDDSQLHAKETTTRYITFMKGVETASSYGHHLCVYWLIERVYQEAWEHIYQGGGENNPYHEFAARWGSPEFKSFVHILHDHTKEATRDLGGEETDKLSDDLCKVLELEVAFWQMALDG